MAAGDNQETQDMVRGIRDVSANLVGMSGALLSTNPKLEDLAGGITVLGTVVKYLSANLNNLRGFANLGADFGMDIQLMIQSATGARTSLQALGNMIDSNVASFSLYNGTLGDGVQTFLNMQRDFYFDVGGNATRASLELERLGLTTENINENFLLYDRITTFGRYQERKNTQERNLAAAEFTKSMVAMARLTGQKADEMAKEMEKAMREGDVAAFLPDLTEAAAKDFNLSLASLKGLSPTLANLFTDVVIRGFPREDIQVLYSQLGGTVQAMEEYSRAVKAGDTAGTARAMSAIMQNYAREMQSEQMRALARISGTTAETAEIYRAMGEFASGSGAQFAQLNADLEKQLGRPPNIQEFADAIQARIMRIRSLSEDPPPGSGREATDVLLKADQEIAAMANTLQTELRDLYLEMGTYGQELLNIVRGSGDDLVRETVDMFRKGMDYIGINAATSAEERAARAARATEIMRANNMTQEATNLERTVESLRQIELGGVTPDERARHTELIDEFNRLVRATPTVSDFEIEQANITVTNGTVVDPNLVPRRHQNNGATDPQSIGTLGTVGRLFRDFGKKTTVDLHGIESVQTVEQTRQIMMNAALGNQDALMSIFSDAIQRIDTSSDIAEITRSTTRTMNGMLNTIRSSEIANLRQQMPTIDLTPLQTALSSLPAGMKRPFEEAINSSLKPIVEQLVAEAQKQNETANRMRRGLSELSGDVMGSRA